MEATPERQTPLALPPTAQAFTVHLPPSLASVTTPLEIPEVLLTAKNARSPGFSATLTIFAFPAETQRWL